MSNGHKGHDKRQMSDRDAMKLALEALERIMEAGMTGIKVDQAIAALRQALEQPSDIDAAMLAERERIVDLLMIQHEAAKGSHNYWQVAANLIQADVASDT